MDLEKKISTDIAAVTIMNLARKVRSFLFIPIITNGLNISSYGAFAQLIVITGVLTQTSSLGLPGALVRYGQDSVLNYRSLYSSLMLVSLLVSVLIGSIIFLLSLNITKLFLGTNQFQHVFLIGAFLIPIRVLFQMSESYLRSKMRIKAASVLSTGRYYVAILGASAAIYIFNTDIEGVIMSIVILEGIFTLILQLVVFSQVGLAFPQVAIIRRSLAYSVPMAGANLASNISTRVDRLIVGSFLGAGAVGVYDISYRIASVIMIYQQPISKTFFPEFSRLLEEGKNKLCGEFVTKATRAFTILVIPSIFGLALVGGELVKLASDRSISGQTELLIPLLAIGVSLWGVDHLYSGILFADGDTMLMMKIRGSAAILNIVLNILLIPIFGLIGAVLTTIISYFVAGCYVLYYSRGVAPSKISHRTNAKVVISSVIMYLCANKFIPENIFLLLILSPVIYFTGLFIFKELTISDIHNIRSWVVN